MSQALRRSEKWFRRGLWLVALVFAGILIGLGGTVVGDLPQVERVRTLDDFMDRTELEALRATVRDATREATEADERLAQARLKAEVADSDVASARQSFSNWVATRRATERAEQDPQVIERTQALDALFQAMVTSLMP